MEHLKFEFGPWPTAGASDRPAVIAGVVGSGNMEVLLERVPMDGRLQVSVETSIRGFADTWRAVLSDFAEREQMGDVRMTINDGGATPAVVSLRLSQAAQDWKAAS
jgi:malonate decarboxylase delta subunit